MIKLPELEAIVGCLSDYLHHHFMRFPHWLIDDWAGPFCLSDRPKRGLMVR